MKAHNEERMNIMSTKMRRMALEMAFSAGKLGAHLGGGLSLIEIMAVLYGEILDLTPDSTEDPDRDLVLLGKGHGVLAYYAALYETGFITLDDINSFEEDGSLFIGHPVKNIEKGIEMSSGSLGMAASAGVGLAISAKNRGSKRRIIVILGDGECQEGSNWEAFMLAEKYGLDNLTILIDMNGVQSDGFVKDISGSDNLDEKLRAFGFDLKIINGHDVNELYDSFTQESNGKTKVIIANTVKGKGVSFMENDYHWHHSELTKEQYQRALEEVEYYNAKN